MMTSWKEGRRKIPSNKSSCSLRTVPARREASFLLLSASMTVEAAAVLPLFLFLMANLLYLTEMVRVQSAAEAALYETAAALAEYAFYLEPETAGAAGGSGPAGPEVLPVFGEAAASSLSEAWAAGNVQQRMQEAGVSGGALAGPVTLAGSEIDARSGRIRLSARFSVRTLLSVMGMPASGLQSSCAGHTWTGYQTGSAQTGSEAGLDDTIVYITDYGSVYHRSRDCTYLKPSVHRVPSSSLHSLRNSSGAIYYACPFCGAAAGGSVYVTGYGNRYHSSASCGAIERNAQEVRLSAVKGRMPPCSKCGGG